MKLHLSVAKSLNLAVLAALTFLVTLLWFLPSPQVVPTTSAQTARFVRPLVRGYIVTSVGGKDDGGKNTTEDIYLPNVRVILRDLKTRAISDPVTTDLSGRFTARVASTGSFQVCWDAKGFKPDCQDKPITVNEKFENISTVRIPLPRERGSVALYGRVSLSDGSSPRALEPIANINAFATISLLDENGKPIFAVPVNNDDQYLFPLIPLGKTHQLRIREEGYDKKQPLKLGNPGLQVQRVDFVIQNTPPKIEPLVALDGNKQRVSNPSPGATVVLNARVSDADQDNLRFLWQVSSGTLSSPTDSEPRWVLPNTPGNHAATLIVYDGKGGYGRSNLNLTIDRGGLIFSGTVSGTDAPVLAGAEVDINGRAALTDSRGYFRLHVTDRKRFVLTIRKAGYAFASKIYYDAIVGGRWTLTRATVVRTNPEQAIDLENKRTDRECAGPPSEQLNWKDHPALAVPRLQSGHNNVARKPPYDRKSANDRYPDLFQPTKAGRRQVPTDVEQLVKKMQLPSQQPYKDQYPKRGCGPGLRVKIPKDSLVDSRGRRPTGPVDVQLSTVDLQTPDQMPGNYTVALPNGQARAMQSYGAGTIEVSSGSTKYNLRAGKSATVIIPVDQAQLQSGGPLDSTIPLLTYDEARGVWKQEGTATLQTVDGIRAYVATVTHFTAFNTDLIKTNQSCLAVQNVGMPPTYDLEVTIPTTGGAAPEKRLFHIPGGLTEYAILNLPQQTNVVLVPIRTDDLDANQNNLPMGVFVVNTGAPQNPASPTVVGGFSNEPVGPPYYHETAGVSDGPCSTKVELTDLGLHFYPGTPPQGAFLHGLGSFAAVNLSDTDPAFAADTDQTLRDAVAQASLDYRGQIDPRGLRPTLSCFKVTNRMPLKPGESCPQHTGTGFVPQAALPEKTAVYANTVDLGFGREMHCVQDGSNVACYVSNYDSLVYTGPGEGTDVAKAQHAVDGFNGLIQPDATVAMEFSQIEDDVPDGNPVSSGDPARIVKFYVFNQAGTPLDSASLDGLGQRPVPQLCMVCHGGQIPNPTGTTSTAGAPGTPPVITPVFGNRDEVKLGAKFLPFDLQSFTYAAPDSDAANPFSKLNQQNSFRDLNQMVKIAPPPDGATAPDTVITDLFTTWYPGDATPQLEDQPVPLWTSDNLHRSGYRNVVARACRTCHVANPATTLRFEQPGTSAGVSFDGNLGTVQLRVCKQHVMPHARRTHDLFWTSINPSQAAQLQVYGDTINAFGWQRVGNPGVDLALLCGQEYTQGGGPTAPPTAFTPIATIFSGCAGCHNAGNAAPGSAFPVAGLNLEGLAAYSRIVDINSTELPSMKLIAFGTNTENTSYLWHKINNSHIGQGGSGDAMPCCGGPGLVTDDNAAALAIRDWIRAGAPP